MVVANAAHVPPLSSLLDADEADIDLVWQTNVAGPLRLVRAAVAGPFADQGGVVVMVGSLGGQALQPDMGLYSASKAALHHLTRILAAELGRPCGSTRWHPAWSEPRARGSAGRRPRR